MAGEPSRSVESELPYVTLPAAPARVDACGVLARMVDGLGFRYHWATHDLPAESASWRAATDGMSFAEVVAHVHRLARFVRCLVTNGEHTASPETTIDAWRRATLHELATAREAILAMDAADLEAIRIERKNNAPFWNLINGPLADALTHVGQLNAWRRQFGHPTPSADVFFGRPPSASNT